MPSARTSAGSRSAAHAITCVGQPEQVAGERAGAEFQSQNAANVLRRHRFVSRCHVGCENVLNPL